MVCLDTESLSEWDEHTDVGPASMTAQAEYLQHKLDEIREMEGVAKAGSVATVRARLTTLYKSLLWEVETTTAYIDDLFIESYPTVFRIIEGRMPANRSEIALEQSVASALKSTLGFDVNMTVMLPRTDYQLTLVGIFELGAVDNHNPNQYSLAKAIVLEQLITFAKTGYVYVSVPENVVTPFNPRTSLSVLTQVEESIRSLDEDYGVTRDWSLITVIGMLKEGINEYRTYLQELRLVNVYRAGSSLVLAVVTSLLVVRKHVTERKKEINRLHARGVPQSYLNRILNFELLALSLAAAGIGFLLGTLLGWMATSSTGFLTFDFSLLLNSRVLVTLDCLIFGIVIGTGLPMITAAAYLSHYRTRVDTEPQGTQLGKYSRITGILRWDLVLIVIGLLVFSSLHLGGFASGDDFVVSLILESLPLVIFIGLANLSIGIVRKGSPWLAKMFSPLMGRVSASVGIRRMVKESASAVPAAMVLVLALSSSWNSALVSTTLPYTATVNTRFAIGGDVSFHLDSSSPDSWQPFLSNVTSHPYCTNATFAAATRLDLSTEGGNTADFVAVNPEQLSYVAYDEHGIRLEESDLRIALNELASNPLGAIVTEDIASDMEIGEDDLLRAFLKSGNEIEVFEFVIVAVVDYLPDRLVSKEGKLVYTGLGYSYVVGQQKVFVNIGSASEIIQKAETLDPIVFARVDESEVGAQLAYDLIAHGASQVIDGGKWSSAYIETTILTQSPQYLVQRGVDMVTVMVGLLASIAVFLLYSMESLQKAGREMAILEAMGSTRGDVTKTQVSETVGLTFFSLLMVMMFSPLMISNELLLFADTHSGSWHRYPVPIQISIPIALMGIILALFITTVFLVNVIVTLVGANIELNQALDASWAHSLEREGV
jgi:hypothetical protein